MRVPILSTSSSRGIRSWVVPFAIALVSLPVGAGQGFAQSAAVEMGQRVRVTGSGFRNVGIVTAANSDSVTLVIDNTPAPISMPWNRVSRVEVRTPHTRGQGALRGAKWGVMIGGAYGLMALLISGTEDISAPELLGITAAEGAAIGGIVGVIRPGGAWRVVPRGPELSMRMESHMLTLDHRVLDTVR